MKIPTTAVSLPTKPDGKEEKKKDFLEISRIFAAQKNDKR